MTRATRSTRQQSRSSDRLDELINLRRYPVDPVEYDNLLQQHQALLAAIAAVPTPASPDDELLRYQPAHPIFQDFGLILPDVPGGIFALDREDSATPEAASGLRASRRSKSVTPASRGRVPVGSTPMLPAQSPPAGGRVNGGCFDLPANFFDSSPPRARAMPALAGGAPSPEYTPTSPAYNPASYSPLFGNASRSPVGGAVARRLDGIDATLERLQRRVDLRADRIDAQLLAITQTLSNQRKGAATLSNDRKRKRSSDNRDVVDLTGKTPSTKKVDFVDLVTESSWSGSEFSSSGSSSSSSDSSSSSSSSADDDDDDNDKPSTPSKKPKPSPSCFPSSSRSPRTPPNNRTPSPRKTPRKAPPKRPAPRTPPRQRAPSVPSTPPTPRKTKTAAAGSPAAQAPRTPPRQTTPATPAAPRKSRLGAHETASSPSRAPAPAPAPSPAPARQPTRASSRIRERAAGTVYRPLLEKKVTGRGVRKCPRSGHK